MSYATYSQLLELVQHMAEQITVNRAATYSPVGTVISYMGTTAPTDYLKCDGTVYNISSYPKLAAHFQNQFGYKNFFGGNGSTTFAVPDLRGEFLRGTGSNGHANQGGGAYVGTHQDATIHFGMWYGMGGEHGIVSTPSRFPTTNNSTVYYQKNADKSLGSLNAWDSTLAPSRSWFNMAGEGDYTARPTNTSVLYCIAYRDSIYDGTPIGNVIFHAGVTAPPRYLACDGTVYNISAYPDLAEFIRDNYGASNYFGGNGSTTFAVPNWQGEFFRAAGTNGHASQGSGASVGTHQDGTNIPLFGINQSSGDLWVQTSGGENYGTSLSVTLTDTIAFLSNKIGRFWRQSNIFTDGSGIATFTSRPTNTSLLACIKAAF